MATTEEYEADLDCRSLERDLGSKEFPTMITWRKSQAPSLPIPKSQASNAPRAKSPAESPKVIPVSPVSVETRAPVPRQETASEPQRAPIVIDSSIHIKGELMVDGDLVLEARVEGAVVVGKHCLTVGPKAHVTANLHADTVRVLGKVVGTISADRRVEIQASGSVEGDVYALQVAIAEGSNFQGSINKSSSSPLAQVVVQEIDLAVEHVLTARDAVPAVRR